MKIGIYGGTFNPPHLGHFEAARTCVTALGLDKLILIPAAAPPHKQLPGGTPTAQERLELVRRLADCLELPGVVEVSTMELDRQGKSYTSDTLRQMKQLWPQAELVLLMGTDMFLTLHLWHEPEVIMDLAQICAFGRTQQDSEDLFAPQREYLARVYGARITTISLPGLVDVSSTRLRQLLERGEGRKYLLPAVYGHILLNGLYGTRAELTHLGFDDLRACSLSMVKAKRFRHIMGTEEEAVRLARHWGEDEVSARRAGILHDCTKYLGLEEQLALCDRYQIPLDELERHAVKLLHSKTGAGIAKHVFGEADQVYDAIFWHTTGKADMTRLEQILYLADYIEENRDFDGVEEMRRLAYIDMDKAMLMGVEMTIEDMQARGNPIHIHTEQARQWLLAKADQTGEA